MNPKRSKAIRQWEKFLGKIPLYKDMWPLDLEILAIEHYHMFGGLENYINFNKKIILKMSLLQELKDLVNKYDDMNPEPQPPTPSPEVETIHVQIPDHLNNFTSYEQSVAKVEDNNGRYIGVIKWQKEAYPNLVEMNKAVIKLTAQDDSMPDCTETDARRVSTNNGNGIRMNYEIKFQAGTTLEQATSVTEQVRDIADATAIAANYITVDSPDN